MIPEIVKAIMIDAAQEIKNLRAKNEKMKIRLDAIDDCLALLASSPRNSTNMRAGESVDIVWKIEKFLEDDKTKEQL